MATMVAARRLSSSHQVLRCLEVLLPLLLSSTLMISCSHGLETHPFNPESSRRQNVCDRYQAYHNGTVQLRDALQGLELRPIIGIGKKKELFQYNFTSGLLDPSHPGILAEILDELALRAKFTWRESFAVMSFSPFPENATYTSLLEWSVENYDIAVSWWERSPERLDKGITFLEPWLDNSIILLEKHDAAFHQTDDDDSAKSKLNLTNWLRPFEKNVWALIMFTVLLSAMVYQLIEYLQGERNGRSFLQWFSDNLYLSSINFSQNYEYQPQSAGARLFGVSMTLFALLLTATYTAELASLLVEQKLAPPAIESIEHAILLGKSICTWGKTASDAFIQKEYPTANRVPLWTELEGYEALQQGRCDLLAGSKDAWQVYKGDNRYNPDCDIEWVGRMVRHYTSGFAVKADAGQKCTTFVRDVLNLHMVEMIAEGFLNQMKNSHLRHLQGSNPTTCGIDFFPNHGASSRRLWSSPTTQQAKMATGFPDAGTRTSSRKLRSSGGSGGSAGGTGGSATKVVPGQSTEEEDISSLTVEQMIGGFVLHWSLMAIAVMVTALSTYYTRREGRGRVMTASMSSESESEEAGTGSQHHKHNNNNTTRLRKDQFTKLHSGNKFFHDPRSLSKKTIPPAVEWEARYAQMTAPERAMVELLFKFDGAIRSGGVSTATTQDSETSMSDDFCPYNTQSISFELTAY